MILFTKAHPVTQAMSAARAPVDLNEPGLRRNPGEPSAAQAEASSYNKPRIKWQGLTIAVENPAGSVRRGRNRHGVTWEVRMRFDYGEILGSMGVDGDPVDIYMGPNPDAPTVYVVHQRRVNDWTEYDEDKVMAGFDCQADAEAAFLSNYNDPRFLGPVTAMPVAEFVAKVRATKDQPAMIKAAAPMVLFFKAHVGAYLRGGKMVNLSGYQGRPARAVTTPGQLSLFGSNKPMGPSPFKGKDPVASTCDLFDADEHGEVPPGRSAYREDDDDMPVARPYSQMTPTERAAFDGRNGITQSRRELVSEHERLADVLRSPSHEDDKAEAKKQAAELAELKGDADPGDDDAPHIEVKDGIPHVQLIEPKESQRKRYELAGAKMTHAGPGGGYEWWMTEAAFNVSNLKKQAITNIQAARMKRIGAAMRGVINAAGRYQGNTGGAGNTMAKSIVFLRPPAS